MLPAAAQSWLVRVLVVTVEVWPDGDLLRRRVIGTMNLANVSQLADVSNYVGYRDGREIVVEGHERAEGAWALVRKALAQ